MVVGFLLAVPLGLHLHVFQVLGLVEVTDPS